MTGRDTPARLLDAAVRRLPREWAEAMRAELATLTDGGERRRFAAGCVIAVLRRTTTAPALGRGLVTLAVGAVAIALAIGIGDAQVRAEALGIVAVVAIAAGVLRRWLRVAPGRGAALARTGGCLLIGLELLNTVYRWRHWPRTDLDGARLTAFVSAPLELAVLLACLAVVLVLTSRRSAIGRWPLVLACGTGAAAALGSFLPALLNTAVPQSARGLVGLVVAAVAVTLLPTAWLTGRLRTAVMAALSAGMIAALGIAALDTGLYQLFPHWVPHIIDRVVPPGMPVADIVAGDEMEAGDPLIAMYLLGMLFALGALLAAGRHSAAVPDQVRGDLERAG